MNAVGKILVMLNLVMSLVFMSFAILVYSTHKNWEDFVKGGTPEVPQGLVGKIEKLVVQNKTATDEIAALKAENAREVRARDDRLALLETKRVSLDTELTAKKAELDRVITAGRATTAQVDALITQIGLKTDEIRQLTETIATQRAQVGDMQLTILKLTSDVAGLATALAAAREQYQILLADYNKLKVQQTGIATGKEIPKLDGVVTNVLSSASDSLVEISLGSDDGVVRGMTFEVTRDAKYLGRIEVIQTTADVAVGRSLAEYRKGNIEKNDNVTTRLVR
jgi:hypothetical protein